MNRREILVSPLALAAIGCATYDSSTYKDEPLLPGQGLLVLRINLSNTINNYDPDITIFSLSQTGTPHLHMVLKFKVGQALRVFAIPEGTYRLGSFSVAGSTREFGNQILFSVVKDQACYVGDIDISMGTWPSFSLTIKNRINETKARFNENYPKASALPFTSHLMIDSRV